MLSAMTRLGRQSCRAFLTCVVLFLSADMTRAQQTVSSSGMKFRFIPGGRFVQGTDGGERVLERAFPLSTNGQNYGNAEGPAHVTWLTKPFYIAETEVTLGQFRHFIDATGYRTSAERGETEMVGWEPTPADKPLYQSHDFVRDAKFNWQNPGFEQADDHPVVGVSYSDAQAYCRWLSDQDGHHYRLPTEAEWEFVCRAGTSTWFSFGDVAKGVVHQFGNLGNVELERHRKHSAERQWLLDWENDPEDGHVFTSPVGSYKRNPWGIADMHGNVWEWCEDLWLDTVYKDFNRPRYDQPTGVAVDPINLDRPQTTANDFHTIRGGSWYNGDLICRSASRAYWDADDASCYIGFRIVRDADPNASSEARDAYRAEQEAIAQIEAAGGKLYSSQGLDIEVRLDGDDTDESVLEMLSLLPDLQRLRIRWRNRDAPLSQSGLNTIASLNQLRVLDFQGGLQLESLDLSALSKLNRLEVLRFPRDAPLRNHHLASLADLTSLVEFQCFGTEGGLTDDGISRLGQNRKLQSLFVWENDATGQFLDAFIGCPLEQLCCTARYGRDGTLTDDHAHRLSFFPSLRALTLEGQNRLSASTMNVIGDLVKLRELNLQRCDGIADQDFSTLSRLQSLRRLELKSTLAGDTAAQAIATIPRIESVSMGYDGQSEKSTLSDAGVAELAKAFSIQALQLMSDAITDEGVKRLGRINRLRDLKLESDKVTGSGFGPLAALPELRDVSLRTPGLQDIAFEHLSRAKSVTKLRLADRGYRAPTALTDSGVMKMASATWLRELWLPRNGTGITEDAINKLNQRMPKTNVIAYAISED